MPQLITAESTSSSDLGQGVHWLEEAKYAIQQTTDEEIVVDISAVAKITSAELNELIRLHLDVKQDGRRLVLQNAQLQLWQIFTLTRLNRLIDIRDPVTEA